MPTTLWRRRRWGWLLLFVYVLCTRFSQCLRFAASVDCRITSITRMHRFRVGQIAVGLHSKCIFGVIPRGDTVDMGHRKHMTASMRILQYYFNLHHTQSQSLECSLSNAHAFTRGILVRFHYNAMKWNIMYRFRNLSIFIYIFILFILLLSFDTTTEYQTFLRWLICIQVDGQLNTKRQLRLV